MSEAFTTPIGRLVGGHPLKRNPVFKDSVKVMLPDKVTQATEAYIGVAIPKTPNLDWKQEPWGQAIVRAGIAGWPDGQTNAPTFAWKITDGDSATPNTNNTVPNTKEGYPGHWILNMSTRYNVRCSHAGNFNPLEEIADENAIKPGDFCRVYLEAKGNTPSKDGKAKPGVYLNPSRFELSRAGELIILDGGASAEEAFGGGGAATQTQATTQPNGANVAPATDFLNPGGPTPPGAGGPTPPATEPNRLVEGKVYTAEQLRGFKWAPAQIEAAQIAP